MLDWDAPLRHATFYKAAFRAAVLRARRLTPAAALPARLKFHALRHTHASLCIAAGRPPLEVARFMGHANVSTTLGVYAHLYEDDHGDADGCTWSDGGRAELRPERGVALGLSAYCEHLVHLHGGARRSYGYGVSSQHQAHCRWLKM